MPELEGFSCVLECLLRPVNEQIIKRSFESSSRKSVHFSVPICIILLKWFLNCFQTCKKFT